MPVPGIAARITPSALVRQKFLVAELDDVGTPSRKGSPRSGAAAHVKADEATEAVAGVGPLGRSPRIGAQHKAGTDVLVKLVSEPGSGASVLAQSGATALGDPGPVLLWVGACPGTGAGRRSQRSDWPGQ